MRPVPYDVRKLARRRRHDSLGTTHNAGTHQWHKHEYTRGCQHAAYLLGVSVAFP
jgi:hypothetical protein